MAVLPMSTCALSHSLSLLLSFSGGKDSCYNLIECVREGHDIVALGNLKPIEKGKSTLNCIHLGKDLF